VCQAGYLQRLYERAYIFVCQAHYLQRLYERAYIFVCQARYLQRLYERAYVLCVKLVIYKDYTELQDQQIIQSGNLFFVH